MVLSVNSCKFSSICFAWISLYVIIAIGFFAYSLILASICAIPTLVKPDIPIGLFLFSICWIKSTNFLDLPSSPIIVFIGFSLLAFLNGFIISLFLGFGKRFGNFFDREKGTPFFSLLKFSLSNFSLFGFLLNYTQLSLIFWKVDLHFFFFCSII